MAVYFFRDNTGCVFLDFTCLLSPEFRHKSPKTGKPYRLDDVTRDKAMAECFWVRLVLKPAADFDAAVEAVSMECCHSAKTTLVHVIDGPLFRCLIYAS